MNVKIRWVPTCCFRQVRGSQVFVILLYFLLFGFSLVFGLELSAQEIPEDQSIVEDDPITLELQGSKDVPAEANFFFDQQDKVVGVFSAPLRLSYPAAFFTLFADSAVIWVAPSQQTTSEESGPEQASPQKVFFEHLDEMELYAEGNIWLRYGQGKNATTLRIDALYFQLVRGDEGNFSLRGVAYDLRAHTSLETLENLQSGEVPEPSKKPQEPAQKKKGFVLEDGNWLFLRAEKVRLLDIPSHQEGVKVFELEEGSLTTSSFALPQYQLASKHIRFELSQKRKSAILDHPRFDFLGHSLLVFPDDDYFYDLESDFPDIRFDFSRSQAFGASLQTKLDVITAYDFFFDPEPAFRPFRFSPLFDWYSKRGVGTGFELAKKTEAPFPLEFKLDTYYISDRGDRRAIARELGFFPLRSKERARARGYLKAFPDETWAFDANLYWQSDRTFVEEFFREEFLKNEERRSFLFLKKSFGNESYFAQTNLRARDFVSEVEALPLIGVQSWRKPIGPAESGLFLSMEAQAGLFRMRTAETKSFYDRFKVFRGDFKMLLQRPFDFGIFVLEPSGGFRLTAQNQRVQSSPGQNPLFDDAQGFRVPLTQLVSEEKLTSRLQALQGFNIQTHFLSPVWRFDDSFLGFENLQHIVTPEVRWENVLGNEGRSHQFFQLDQVDAADVQQKATFSLRNRFISRTRSEGLLKQRKIDFLLELPFYPNKARDNQGENFGELEGLLDVRLSSKWSLRSGFFWDIEAGNVMRSFIATYFDYEDLRWQLSFRDVRSKHSILGAGLSLNLSRNYLLNVQQEYDFRRGGVHDMSLRVSRSLVDTFYLHFTFRRDGVTKDLGFSLSLSLDFDT